MKKHDTLTTLMRQQGIPGFTPVKAEENTDYLWRKCRHCGKSFRAKLPYHICCSWNCTQAYKAAQIELDKLDAQPYKGHPF